MHNNTRVKPCEHLKDGDCRVAEVLANRKSPIPVPEEVCVACQASENPMSPNTVTCGMAIRILRGSKIPDDLKECATSIPKEPVGSELRKLISWFVWSKQAKECSKCKNREQIMNIWGAEKCQANMDIIMDWMRSSAKEHGLPYSEAITRRVVQKAINNSRRCLHAQHGICRVASRLAGVPARFSDKACRSCERDLVPRSANSVTAGLACKARQAAGLSEDRDLKEMSQGVYVLAGYRLERYIGKWMKRLGVVPPEDCGCEAWVSKMNAWGVQGSIEHLDEIVDQVFSGFKSTYLGKLAPGRLSKPFIRRRIKACLLKELS